jgi:hypothetical protein
MSATQTASPDDRDFRLTHRSGPYRDPAERGDQSLMEHRPTYFDDAIDRWVNEGGALSRSGATYHTTASC